MVYQGEPDENPLDVNWGEDGMSQADDPMRSTVPDPPATSSSEVDPTRPDSAPRETATSHPKGRVWMMVLAGGLLAGLAGFGLGEYSSKLFAPSLELPPAIRRDQVKAPLEHARRRRVSQDQIATMTYGGLGALLGLTLGAVGGLARRSPRAAITAALIGLVLGAAAGFGTTFLLLPWFHAHYTVPGDDSFKQELGLALATHGGIWAAIGAAAGLALGLGLGGGRVSRAIFGGILGAAVAALIYEIGAAAVFPMDQTFLPLAIAPAPRLLAHLVAALCVSAGAIWAAYHLSLRRQSSRAHT
jgi:hypothetical protein